MPKIDYYKKLFFVGALWNWAATLGFFFGYSLIFDLLGMTLPRYSAFFELFLALAFVFGIGYYWVSKDVTQNHAVIKIGAIAKIIVFVVLTLHWMIGDLPFLLVVPGIVDLVFAILFIEFLHTAEKASSSR